MSFALTNLSRWWLGGKQKEPKLHNGTELNLWESDTGKFPLIVGSSRESKSRRFNRKLHTRQEQKIDREHDVVLVPSDGGCISDSDSDASDWSIGWSEPHALGFQSDDENDGGFGVLVPCYGSKNRDAGDRTNEIVEAKASAIERYRTDAKKHVEQWIYSIQAS